MEELLRKVNKGKTEYYYDDENRLVCKINHCKNHQGRYFTDIAVEHWYYYDQYGELVNKKIIRYHERKNDIFDNNTSSIDQYETAFSNRFYSDEKLIEKHLLHDLLCNMLNDNKIFKDRERDVVRMYYGIGCEHHTLNEIGEIYGVSGNRIMQIRENALRKFRKTVRRRKLIDFLENM